MRIRERSGTIRPESGQESRKKAMYGKIIENVPELKFIS